MIKMFARDLDGTLLNALHEADGTIRRAIRELTEAGLHVVPATGRSTLPIGEHGFTGLALDACCSNGSIVRDSHGEVLKTCLLYSYDDADEEVMTDQYICLLYKYDAADEEDSVSIEHEAGIEMKSER